MSPLTFIIFQRQFNFISVVLNHLDHCLVSHLVVPNVFTVTLPQETAKIKISLVAA